MGPSTSFKFFSQKTNLIFIHSQIILPLFYCDPKGTHACGIRLNSLNYATTILAIHKLSIDGVQIMHANQQIVEDFNIDRKEYTAQLLQVLHRVMEKGTQTNQMGAVTAAVAQAIRLARLDR